MDSERLLTLPGETTLLPGEICEQYIRCGKPGCRCEEGRRHGPYFYRVWREGDHVHKVYVKREDLEHVRQACDAHRHCQQALRDARLRRERLSRDIHHQWRTAQRLLRQVQTA